MVFPRIDEELRKGRIQLEPIDLRQGVETADLPSEEADIRSERVFACDEDLLASRLFWFPLSLRQQAVKLFIEFFDAGLHAGGVPSEDCLLKPRPGFIDTDSSGNYRVRHPQAESRIATAEFLLLQGPITVCSAVIERCCFQIGLVELRRVSEAISTILHAVKSDRIGERHASACRYKNDVPEGLRRSAHRSRFRPREV